MQLVALDLDGTLLGDGGRIPRENRQAITEAVQAGVKVMICSGRMAFSAVGFALELGLDNAPAVAMNGAHIIDPVTGRTLHADFMQAEGVRAVLEAARSLGMYFSVYERYHLWGSAEKYSAANYLRIAVQQADSPLPVTVHIQPDMEKMLAATEGEVIKCLVADEDPQKLAACRKLLAGREDITVTSSGSKNLEIIPAGVDKGTGLAFAARYLGIPMERVMAVGDNENDWGMLRVAGLPVVMGNGTADTRAMAKYVTDTNVNGGVAKAIRKFCFEGEE